MGELVAYMIVYNIVYCVQYLEANSARVAPSPHDQEEGRLCERTEVELSEMLYDKA